jgi:hypothetical protein
VQQEELERLVEDLRTRILDVGGRFAAEAGPAVAGWLEGAVERLVVAQADRINELRPDAISALRSAVRETSSRAGEEASRRLREPDIWLQPTVALDRDPDRDLAHPNNRAWIAVVGAIRALDPVLVEFGLDARPIPAIGGGHFELEPRRLSDIDRRGSLARLWDRYLDLHERYRETLQRIPEERRRQEREEAIRRWREAR